MTKLTKNFELHEFDCKDGTKVPVEYINNVTILAKQLQIIRDYLSAEVGEDTPIQIISGWRSEDHNKKVGGAKNSMHLKGKASDIRVKKEYMLHLHLLINELIDTNEIIAGGITYYKEKNFIHYDIRGVKTKWKV
jgi:uncharacterized protein YcbK (DUF882 family)